MLTRYLTPNEKARELVSFSQIRETSPESGPGIPDPEILPWCDRINAIEGICTLQSCAGHERNRSSGHLWVRLDEHKALRVQGNAFELAQCSTINRVSLIYQPWGQEVLQIEFRGTPDGQLENSMRAILSFLESL